jgi:chromosome partitioning protein
VPTVPGQLSDVLLGRLREVCEVAFPTPHDNLHLAGSDKQLAETEMILAAKIGKELILDGALAATRTRWDLIVLDCPPNLGTLTLNALCAADELLMPTDASVLALEGIGDILAAVELVKTRLARRVRPLGILATRHDRRATQMNDAIRRSIGDLYGGLLLETAIPQCSALNKAHMAGESIFTFDRRSSGAVAYDALAEELAGKLGLRAAVAAAPARRAAAR